MYAITEKESGQWVSKECVNQREWKNGQPGYSHCTQFFPKAAVFHDEEDAAEAMKDLLRRFEGRVFKIEKLFV